MYVRPSILAGVSILIVKKLYNLDNDIVWSQKLTQITGY